MRIAIGSDHAGFGLKALLVAHLTGEGHSVVDHGPVAAERCDYPDFAALVGHDVAAARAEFGVLVCGSGIGMSIAANKIRGVRAVCAGDVEHAVLSRQHNHANVLCLGERFTAPARAVHIMDTWLNTVPEAGRHVGRVSKIMALEDDATDRSGT
jgi:ribose 5-phosphate isomerase B